MIRTLFPIASFDRVNPTPPKVLSGVSNPLFCGRKAPPQNNSPFEKSDHPLSIAIKQNKGMILRHTTLDTSQAPQDLEAAIQAGTSYEIDGNLVELNGRQYLVNAHHPLTYQREVQMPFPSQDNPEKIHPARLLPRILESGLFTKFDFKCPEVVEPFANLASTLPYQQKMGHMFLKELMVAGVEPRDYQQHTFLSLQDLQRARRLMGSGDTPFQVSCFGVTPDNLTPELAATFARKIQGQAQYINFHLPNRGNPPVSIVKMLWEKYGLVTEIKIDSKQARAFWNRQGIPYLGSTDDNRLADVIRTT